MKRIVIAWVVSLSAASASAAFSPSDQPILFELSVKRNRVEVRPGGSRDQSFLIDPSVSVSDNDLGHVAVRGAIGEDIERVERAIIGNMDGGDRALVLDVVGPEHSAGRPNGKSRFQSV